MINLDKVTLVLVTSVNIERAIKSLKYSMRGIKFAEVKLFTDLDVNPGDGIKVVKIPKIDYLEYSRFIVYELYKYIETDFALITQDDGFVVNPEKWDDDFMKYDYLGAPWPLPTDNFSYRDSFGNIVRVGNGGFSLRSKKLLKLSTDLELEWKSYFGFYNEDGFFTCHNRHIFENNGCVFPSIEVAAKFSHEIQLKETLGIKPFGFHGKNNIYYNFI
jgi:hypothetical protein